MTPTGEVWPDCDPPCEGRVRYGGIGDSREGLWDAPEIKSAAERYAADPGPVPVYVPEMGDSKKQYLALVRLIYESGRDAMAWLQNSKMSGPDQILAQFCQRAIHGPRGHGSFITGSVANPLPHVGDAMATMDPLLALPHVTAAVAMSRRYDRTQKTYMLQSLRRAYWDIARPYLLGDHRTDCIRSSPGIADAIPDAPPKTPTSSDRVLMVSEDILALLQSTLAGGTTRGTGDPTQIPTPGMGGENPRDLAETCTLACTAVFDSLIFHCGGVDRMPGLFEPPSMARSFPSVAKYPSPVCPPDALCAHPDVIEAVTARLYSLRDLVELSRIRGGEAPPERLSRDDLQLVVHSLLLVARTLAPLVRYNIDVARKRAPGWNLTRAVFAIPSRVASLMEEVAGTPDPHTPTPRATASGNRAGGVTVEEISPPRSSNKMQQRRDVHNPVAGGCDPLQQSPSNFRPLSPHLTRPQSSIRCKRKSEPLPRGHASGNLPIDAVRGEEMRAHPPTDAPPPTKKRAGPPRGPLGPMPLGGPSPKGGFRRIPSGDCHTPRPTDAVSSVYCPPEIVAELVDHPLFPEAWRSAITFDPGALATIAARCTGPRRQEGTGLGGLVVSAPLRRASAWMTQIADPEDVKVVVLYNPLPHEHLAHQNPNRDSRHTPAWSETKGGLSTLLAALGNRLLSPESHSWAGNWSGPPDIRRLNAQGVLLLSTGDLAFAGCVEYLCLRLGSARRRLIVFDTVDPEDWPATGPAVSHYHLYIRATVTPTAYCAVRWPALEDLSRAVLTSSAIFGPGSFARVEAAFERLYPNCDGLRLCASGNVGYTVRTDAGDRTPVPMLPREYRQRVLPAYDGCKDMEAQSAGLKLGEPDFVDGAAHSHRACNRWGLGAPLRPVYLATGRRALASTDPTRIPAVVRAFCRTALLAPDTEAPPLILTPADPQSAIIENIPGVTWDSGFGKQETVIRIGGRSETLSPPNYHTGDSQAVEIVSVETGINGPGSLASAEPVKVEVVSDDEDAESGWFHNSNPYI